MLDSLVKNGQIDTTVLKKYGNDYRYAKRTKKGRVSFKTFAGDFGTDRMANIKTPIGHVKININSQFWKMLQCKENRHNLLFNIKPTLKNPMYITLEDGSYKFYSCLKKKNGSMVHMFSVCGKDDDGNFILKTSYETKNIGKVKILATKRGEILYHKPGISITNGKADMAWELFDSVFTHLKDADKSEKIDFAIRTMITLENKLNALKKEILRLKSDEPSEEMIQAIKEKQERNKDLSQRLQNLITIASLKNDTLPDGEDGANNLKV